MPETREGVVVVVFKEFRDYHRYAILERVKNWEGWELVKGHRDKDEDVATAAKREVREETGVTDFLTVETLPVQHQWEYTRNGTRIRAEYDAVLIQVPEEAKIDVSVNTHEEHARGHFLNYRDTQTMLTHDNQRELVRQAQNTFIPQRIE